MLREFNLINQKNINTLNDITKKINSLKYEKIFYFPFNIYSQYLYEKNNNKKNCFIVDNYYKKNNCIKPSVLPCSQNILLVITDKQLYLEQNLKKNFNKIFFKPYLSTQKKINLDKKKIPNTNLGELFTYFNSDKSKIFKRLNIKQKTHDYGPFYEKHLKDLRKKKLNILEIGSYIGASAASFISYFKNSNVFCMDINHKNFLFKSKRLKLINLNYMDEKKVNKFLKKYNNFFDIIIDDGGHYKSHILNNIKNFNKCLKQSSSIYIIEDFGLKFNYLNDIKNEPDILKFLVSLKNKKILRSNILNKNLQKILINKIKKIYIYKGKWIKYKKNISDICFMEIKN